MKIPDAKAIVRKEQNTLKHVLARDFKRVDLKAEVVRTARRNTSSSPLHIVDGLVPREARGARQAPAEVQMVLRRDKSYGRLWFSSRLHRARIFKQQQEFWTRSPDYQNARFV